MFTFVTRGATPDCGSHCVTSDFNDNHCGCRSCHGKPVKR